MNILQKIKTHLRAEKDFLQGRKGIMHVGANLGQERDNYRKHGLSVAWFEPIPDVFRRLSENISGYPRQSAFNYLLADQDGLPITLNVASNDGASSSIFALQKHKEIWSDIDFVSTVNCTSVTLPTVMKKEGMSFNDFDTLIMDTQGSELLILKGAESILNHFTYIKTEAADFESYKGGCVLSELTDWLAGRGFKQVHKRQFVFKEGVGGYYDVVFRNTNNR